MLGSIVTVLGNSGNLVKAYHGFEGWNTQADGNGATYTQGGTFAMGNSDVILYARWTPLPSYTAKDITAFRLHSCEQSFAASRRGCGRHQWDIDLRNRPVWPESDEPCGHVHYDRADGDSRWSDPDEQRHRE